MYSLHIKETIKIRDMVFYPGIVEIPDHIILELDPKLQGQIVHLPPGTVLRGLWYIDQGGKRQVKWVAYVE